jgi:sialate O-acetylesterase
MQLIRSFTLALTFASAALAAGAITPAAPFSDHMVLQRDQALPVWGTADPGESVTVSFAGQTQSVTADAQGRWRVTLRPLPASAEPREMHIGRIAFTNVVVGEVWICSGQSNMDFRLRSAIGGEALAVAASDPLLRLRRNAPWTNDTPDAARNFSAVGYFFGRELRAALQVPVGLIHACVGGTPAEMWTPRAAQDQQPALRLWAEGIELAKKAYPERLARYQRDEARLLAAYEVAAAKAKAEGKRAPRKPAPPADPFKAGDARGSLYNRHIAPLVPFAMRGVIWYQGEANSGRAEEYQTLLTLLIESWRTAWGAGPFPFYLAQIAPHRQMRPEVREAQLFTTLTVTNTALAVTTDVGDAADIHPKDKAPVGKRLALAARALTYGERIEYSGPIFQRLTLQGDRATLAFTHIGGGLVAKDGPLRGFTIAGADGKFVPATAEIRGNTVIVRADSVPAPTAVRYGWEHVPDVNLFNKEGLPASPFRTDTPATPVPPAH